MERMICGKEMRKVMDSLSKFSGDITAANAKSKLQSFIGNCNYDVSYDSLQTLHIGDSDNIAIKCTIQINDDEGKKIVSKEFFCSNSVTYKEQPKTKTPLNLSMTIEKAQNEAFRRCSMQFYSDGASDQTGKKGTDKPNSAVSKERNEENVIRCKITSTLEPVPNYKNTYRATCILEDNSSAQLIFWYNIISKLKEQGDSWERFIERCPSDNYVTVMVTKNKYRGAVQYSVLEFKE